MKRTYLSLPLAAAAISALQGLPLLANNVPSRAPLGQDQPAGTAQPDAATVRAALRLTAGALKQQLLPPPPVPLNPGEAAEPVPWSTSRIVALEVVPYRP